MKHKKNSFIVCILLTRFCFAFPHWSDALWNMFIPRVEIKSDNNVPKTRGSNIICLQEGEAKSHVQSYVGQANAMLQRYGSPQLQKFFYDNILSIIWLVTINDPGAAIPGYLAPHGLRDLFIDPLLFPSTDKDIIQELNKRLYVYYSAVEHIMYDKREGLWNLSLPSGSRV